MFTRILFGTLSFLYCLVCPAAWVVSLADDDDSDE